MAKPRRKYNPRKNSRNLVLRKAKKVHVYDGKCMPHMEYQGVTPGQPFGREILYSVADDQHDWRIWMGVFESNGADEWVTTGIIDSLPPAASRFLNGMLDDELEKMVRQRNPKHVVSWGWFAIPDKEADLDAMTQDIIDLFRQKGAFDRVHCEAEHAKRLQLEKLESTLESPKKYSEAACAR